MKKSLILLILAWSMSLHAAWATNTWFCDANSPATLAADTGQAGDAGARAAWRDTQIKPTDPTQVLGAQDELGVIKRQTAPDLQAHALFSFTNLFGSGAGQVGAGTTINEAKLWLYVVQNMCTQTITIAGLAAADAEWDESGACYDYITGTTAWSGGTFSQSVAKTFGTFENPTGTGWFAVDITDALREYQTNGIGGIALLSDSESSGEICNFYFASDECAETNRAPGVWVSHGASYSTSTNIGPSGGGNSITISGQTFGNGLDITNVTVCGVAATITGQGVNWVTITLGAGPAGGSAGDIVIQSASVGGTTLTDAYTYNPAGDINDYIADGWTDVSNLVYRRNAMAAASHDGGLFVIGGYDGTAMGEVQRYNGNAWSMATALPVNTAELGAGVVNTTMYAVAGRNSGGSAVSSVYRYTGSSWASAASLPVATYGHGVAVLGTNMYAMGGYSGAVVITNVYRFLGASWTSVAALPGRRAYLGAAVLNDNLYCVGGRTEYSSGATTNVFRYDGTNWTEVTGLPTNRCELAVAGLNGYLYAIGGSTGGWHSVTNVYRFDGTKWDEMRGLPGPRRGPAVCVYSGTLYAIGGSVVNYATNKVYRYTEERYGVYPILGPCTGGFPVSIGGTNLGSGSDITNVTLCGVSVQSIQSQSPTQVIVMAAVAPPGTGDVRVFSAAFGETVQSNVFTYAWPSLKVLGTNSAVIISGEAPAADKGNDFRHVAVGATRTRTFSVTNDGPFSLNIGGWVTTGVSRANFQVSGIPSAVSVGGVSNFTVTFTPDAVAEFTAALEIANNSTTTPYVVNLTGWGYQLSTNVGPYSGGNTITITNGAAMGNGSDITNVLVGGVAAAIVDQGATWVTIILPSTANAGSKDIVVQSESVGESVLSGCYVYHPAGAIDTDVFDTWTEVEGLPASRYSQGVSVLNGSIYAIAGDNYGNQATNVYRYDGEHWTEVAGILNGVSPLGSTGRYSMASATLGSWLYTIGARMAGSGAGTNRVDRFDGMNWETTLAHYYPYHVYGLGAGVLGTNLYAFGGYGNLPGYGSSPLTNVYRFSGTNWVGVPGLPSRRLNMGAGVLNDRLYCVGGRYEYSTDPRTNVFCFDGTNWTEVAGLPTARCDLAVGALDNCLYAVGGSTGSFHAVTNVYRFDGATWSEVKGLPAPRCRLAGAALGNALYAVGGYGTSSATNVYRYVWENYGVFPGGGSTNGGYTVTIKGRDLGNGGDITNVTLCGAPVQSIQSQSASGVVVIAGACEPGLGDVRIYSVSFGETVKSDAFEYQLRRLLVYGTNSAVVVSGEAADSGKGTAFRHTAVGRAVTNIFRVSGGWLDLNISGVTTSGAQAANFTVVGMPSTVAAHTMETFSVVFHPDALGSHEASLTIASDGTNSDYVVNLSGSACTVTPLAGPFSGGNILTLTNGTLGNGVDITNIVVGTVGTTNILAQGVNWVSFVVPTNTVGTKDVVVQSASAGATRFENSYTYNPPGAVNADVPTTWTPVAGLAQRREHHATATLNGQLYVVGGWYDQTSSAVTNVYRFDGTNWTQVAGLPQARYDLGCSVMSGALYAVGGYNSGGKTNVYRFDGTNWSEIVGLPATRYALGCGTLDSGLYAIGGSSATNVYRFDGTAWTQVAGLPAAREGFGCVVQNGEIVVLGGALSSVTQSNVYRFNGTTWTETTGLLRRDCYFGCGALDDKMYVLHGYGWGTDEGWRTNAYRWTASGWSSMPGLPYPYNMYLAGGVLNGRFYSIGGDNNETNVYRMNEGTYGVFPSQGATTGGYPVTICGSNLCDGADVTNVTLCGVSVASIQSQSSTQIVVIAAPGLAGWGDVRVYSTSFGEALKTNAFTYEVPMPRVLGTNGALVISGESATAAKGTAFGSASADVVVTNRFSIQNGGVVALMIGGVTTNGADAGRFQVLGMPSSVSAGGSSNFWIAFQPGAVGSYAATLEIANDSTTTPYVVNLSGSAYQVSPRTGPAAGGNTMLLTNSAALGNGSDITNVTVCGVAAAITAQGTTWVQITLGAGPAAGSTGAIVVQSASLGSTTFPGSYTYNPAGFIGGYGSWTEVRGLSMGRYSHASAVLNDQLYVVGGYYSGARTNVHRFDGSVWTEVAGLPQTRQQHGCAVLNGALYAIGGYSSYTNVYRFDGSSWTQVRGLPQARYDFGCGVFSGAIYVVGGYYSGTRTNVYRFDGTNWTEVAGLPATRYALSCVTLDDGLYAMGGDSYTNVYRFNGTSWTQVRGLPAARSYFGSCAVSGRIDVVAGSNGTTNHYRFDGTNWTELAGLPASTYQLSCESFNGRLYAIGGYYQRTNVLCFNEPASGVSPGGGGLGGGETVTIRGVNLGAGDVTNVTLCGVSVSSIVSQSSTQVVVIAAAGGPGPGDVRVYSVSFGSTVKANAYDYQTPNLTVLGTNMAVVASGEAANSAKGTAFGHVPIGRAATNRLTLRSGWADISISGVTTSGPGAAAFRVANPPANVPANSTAPLDVVFDPAELGSHEATLTITSDATNSPYVINLSGSACTVTPLSGPAAGGTTVTLTNGLIGSGDDITNILVGVVSVTSITAQGTNWVTFVAPTGSAGSVDITIQSASIGNTIFSRCYRYNPPGAIAVDVPTSWSAVAGLPDARSSLGCGVLNGFLYAVGGVNSSSRTNVFRFNGTNWTEVAGLPAARSSLGCGVLNGRLYAMGSAVTNVYCFDGTNWTEAAAAPAALNGPACAVYDNAIYAIAGNSNTNVYRFNGTNWTEVAGLPQARSYLGAGVMNGALYAVGGYHNSTSVASVFRFNGTSWTEVSPLPAPVSLFGCEVLNDRIHIVNGYAWGSGDWKTNVFSYTEVESRHVTGLSSRQKLACGVLNGDLYAVGGDNSGWAMTNVLRFFAGRLGVTPARGSSAGGYAVTIVGSNLCDGADVTNVTLCGVSVSSIDSQSPTQIVVTAGAGGSGYGNVCVYSTSYGTTIKADAFAYDTPGIQVRGTNGVLIASGEAADAVKGTGFRSVRAGMTVTNWLSVSNNGTATMNISGWTTNGTGAARFRISGLPSQLLSRAVASFPIVFESGEVGSYSASLEIENDTVTTPYIVNLTGSSFDLDVDNGPLAGGNTSTITNGSFGTITNVLVGGVVATIQAGGANWVTITVPAVGSAGVKDLVVQAEEGSTTLPAAYTVNPQGQIGGTSINLHGVVCRYEFTNTMEDSLGNGLAMTSYNNTSSGYTTSGLYWVAAGSPGGGLTGYGPSNSAQGSNYTLRIQCSYSAVSGYRRLVRHQVNDYGLYVYSGRLYPLGAGESLGPTNAVNVMMDLYITRDATSNVVRTWQVISNTVWYCGGGADDSRYFAVQGYGTNRPLWRFFHDDGSEYTPSGVVRRIWMWDQPLTSNQISDIYSSTEVPGVVPDNGSTVGGYEVVINGTDLGNGSDITNVTLCGVSAATIVSQSATQVVVTAGAGSPGTGDVRVCSVSYGASVASNAFTYVPGSEASLTIVTPYGAASPAVGVHTNPVGTVLTNSISTPDTRGTTQYVCAGWTMTGHEPASGSGTQVVMTVTNDAMLTWLWTTNCWLDVEAGAHGSVNVGEGWQAFGVTTQLTATADTYYHFAGWTGDISPSDISSNPVNVFMDGSKVVVADFAENLATNATPEWWLASHGWEMSFDEAAIGDQDGDLVPTWKEYVAGTVPTNERSVFLAESAPVLAFDGEVIKTNQLGVVCTVNVYRVESLILGWPSATGRVYSVSCGSVLGSFDTVLAADLPATPNWNSYTCDVHGAVATALYYRVQVRLP